METAQLVQGGENQVVLLPEAYHLPGDRVYIKRMGSAVVLIPYDRAWQSMIDSLDLFSEDCFSDRDHLLSNSEGLS
ncbi:MAG: hypothetical protein OHK0022_56230 [Roseiflexaceae bacterium]